MKVGSIFRAKGKNYVLVDLRMLYPYGLFDSNTFDEQPYCLLQEGSLLNTFNGMFSTIEKLCEHTEGSINSEYGKKHNYMWFKIVH